MRGSSYDRQIERDESQKKELEHEPGTQGAASAWGDKNLPAADYLIALADVPATLNTSTFP
jgi:hypothetical protein